MPVRRARGRYAVDSAARHRRGVVTPRVAPRARLERNGMSLRGAVPAQARIKRCVVFRSGGHFVIRASAAKVTPGIYVETPRQRWDVPSNLSYYLQRWRQHIVENRLLVYGRQR